MPGFDIKNILELDIAPFHYRCVKCLAFLDKNIGHWATLKPKPWLIKCPTCDFHYNIGGVEGVTINELVNYMKIVGHKYEYEDFYSHCARLAEIAKKIDDEKIRKKDIYFAALAEARHFVHFMTWGNVAEVFQAAYKIISLKGVDVSGITAAGTVRRVFRDTKKLQIKDIPKTEGSNGDSHRGTDIPHQKLTIIDGLLMFKGSANLTKDAWDAADKGGDVVEIETNIDEIAKFNNKYFSPWWGSLSRIGDRLVEKQEEEDDYPFEM